MPSVPPAVSREVLGAIVTAWSLGEGTLAGGKKWRHKLAEQAGGGAYWAISASGSDMMFQTNGFTSRRKCTW